MLGVVMAAFVAFRMSNGAELAPIVAASGLVYLGAAALRKPSAAWPLFVLTFVVISFASVGLTGAEMATWTLIAIAGALFVFGFARGAMRQAEGLQLQAAAMIAFGAIAISALIVDQTVGAYLVATGLLGHAAWDVYHHRTNKVVVRSMAEFCFVLDTLLAIAIIVATLRG